MPVSSARAGLAPSADLREPPIEIAAPPQAPDRITPAMRQYAQQKALVPDAILLFRMGDFYEMFYDDAKTAARVLGLALTSRSKEQPVPLAGIPYHALDAYLSKLVAAGYKVAISEQMEDARFAKGVVRREIQRVITPGTLTDDALLDARRDNLLVAICAASPLVGLAGVELASGRFWTSQIPAADLADELARLRPSELLAEQAPIDRPDDATPELCRALSIPLTRRPADRFDPHRTQELLLEQFRVRTLAGFGFDAMDDGLRAAGAILDYLRETQRGALAHVLKIERRAAADAVAIDSAALRGLEVERTLRDGGREGSLLWAIDRTCNPMGARRLRQWLCFPLRRAADILARQAAITALRGDRLRLASLRDALRNMTDVQRVLGRLGTGRASPRDMAGLARSLRQAAEVATALPSPSPLKAEGDQGGRVKGQGDEVDAGHRLAAIAAVCRGWSELCEYLSRAIRPDAAPLQREGGYIADGFDADLDRLRGIRQSGHRWLAEYQSREAMRTGIPTLKVAYNQVFGYYIEVTHTHREKIPSDYVRRQTVRNAERYITDELKKHEDEVLGAADRALAREAELFEQIKLRAAAELPRLQSLCDALADLDALCGLAEWSLERPTCLPQLVERGGDAPPLLELRDGRHPVLDETLIGRFVPNDCRLGGADGLLAIITGPNMAGKSTYIRQVALLTLLAHTGSYVPAAAMRWTPVDRIFARIGASDELARGQSTFMVEMVETACILNGATRDSLVILDEIGRGTSTYDGLALAWAICEHLVRPIGCRTLFATHYHELTELAALLPGVTNLSVLVREHRTPDGRDEIVFLHKIAPGATDRSYGVHVARMAGIPPAVVQRGTEILAELERNFAAETQTPRMKPMRTPRGDADEATLF